MRVGVPKEIKDREYRVGLTPSSVHELVAHGHEVLVQQGAGLGSGVTMPITSRRVRASCPRPRPSSPRPT